MRKESSLPVNRLGLAHALLRVNRRGFVLLLSLRDDVFDRNRGGDDRGQHFASGKSGSLSASAPCS